MEKNKNRISKMAQMKNRIQSQKLIIKFFFNQLEQENDFQMQHFTSVNVSEVCTNLMFDAATFYICTLLIYYVIIFQSSLSPRLQI